MNCSLGIFRSDLGIGWYVYIVFGGTTSNEHQSVPTQFM